MIDIYIYFKALYFLHYMCDQFTLQRSDDKLFDLLRKKTSIILRPTPHSEIKFIAL